MRLSFYAKDIGPAQNIGMVANEALQRGHRVSLVGNDEPGTKDLLSPTPDALVTGLSSFHNLTELTLGKNAEIMGIPWYVLADSHRTWGRQNAAGKTSDVTVLVASPAEISEAKAFGYGEALYAGGPPLWQDFPSTPTIRIPRNIPDEKLIMVEGLKDGRLTNDMCAAVIEACRKLFKNWKIIFKPHGNEDPETEDDVRRAEMLGQAPLLTSPARPRELLGTVDCTVCAPGATDTIAAAHLRRPAICFTNPAIEERFVKMTGDPRWFPAEAGACLKATPETIQDAIREAVSEVGSLRLAARQREVYPLEAISVPAQKRILNLLEADFKKATEGAQPSQ